MAKRDRERVLSEFEMRLHGPATPELVAHTARMFADALEGIPGRHDGVTMVVDNFEMVAKLRAYSRLTRRRAADQDFGDDGAEPSASNKAARRAARAPLLMRS